MSENIGVVIIVKKENKLLLGKRKNGYMEGMYGLPGGRVNTSERLTEGCERELFEETNLNGKDFKYVGVVRENQRDYSFIHFGFLAENAQGELENKEPEKCEGWDFYEKNNFPANILPGHLAIIEMCMNPNKPSVSDL